MASISKKEETMEELRFGEKVIVREAQEDWPIPFRPSEDCVMCWSADVERCLNDGDVRRKTWHALGTSKHFVKQLMQEKWYEVFRANVLERRPLLKSIDKYKRLAEFERFRRWKR